ncbi:MAG: hypothetical protein PHE73_08895 [Sulfurovaceae bacterium]|nr:hypothetical protein [Sulfurovaceae bacterium]
MSDSKPLDDYIDFIEKKDSLLIPKGSKVPHPADWKGNKTSNQNPIIPIKGLKAEDFLKPVEVRGRKRYLTSKQILKAKYMLAGYTRRQAELKAGYSVSTADGPKGKNPPKGQSYELTVEAFLHGIHARFLKEGLTQEYVAMKMKEWFDAQKPLYNMKTGEKIASIPDYRTQLQGFKEWKDLVVPKNHGITQPKKRSITLTEYVMDDKELAEGAVIDTPELNDNR